MATKSGVQALLQSLRRRAASHPDVQESVACEGTVIQSASFKVNGKAFLFLRPAQAMVKLDGSLPEASRLAKANPDTLRAGAGGWVTIPLPLARPLTPALVQAWVEESYGLYAKVTRSRKPTRR